MRRLMLPGSIICSPIIRGTAHHLFKGYLTRYGIAIASHQTDKWTAVNVDSILQHASN